MSDMARSHLPPCRGILIRFVIIVLNCQGRRWPRRPELLQGSTFFRSETQGRLLTQPTLWLNA